MNEIIIASFRDELEKIATVINPTFKATPANLAKMRKRVEGYYRPTKTQRLKRTGVRKIRRGLINTGIFRSTGINR